MADEVIRRFNMLGSDGRTYPAVEIQEYESFTGLKGRSSVPGSRRIELEDGREVILLNNQDTIQGTFDHPDGDR